MPGQGAVGRVFQTQKTERYLSFSPTDDPQTVEDFAGVKVASMLCVPFSDDRDSLGCVQFINRDGGGSLSEEEADVCEMMVMLAGLAMGENEYLQSQWSPGKVIVSVRGVTREFHNGDVVTRALKGVNLDVYEGEFLVLLGESGCGKSTLLNILGGMDNPTSGTFTCFGEQPLLGQRGRGSGVCPPGFASPRVYRPRRCVFQRNDPRRTQSQRIPAGICISEGQQPRRTQSQRAPAGICITEGLVASALRIPANRPLQCEV